MMQSALKMLGLTSRSKWNNALLVAVCCIGILFTYLFFAGHRLKTLSSYSKKDLTNLNYPRIQGENFLTEPSNFFDKEFIYRSSDESKELLSMELKLLTQNAVHLASKNISTSPTNFEHGSFRLLNGGVEFQIFFTDIDTRVSLFQPLMAPQQIHKIDFEENKIVNIIMPLKGKLKAFSLFLDNFFDEVVPNDSQLTLTVVYFKDKNFQEAKSLLDQKLSRFPNFKGQILPLEDAQFSRGKGIQVGMESLGKDPSHLAFFCDVDVFMTAKFFRRCRANSVQHYQVYFPVVYSLYNPSLVHLIKEKSVPSLSEQLLVDGDNGFWRVFGYGMACMHRSEYDVAGGIPDYKVWGSEDVNLFENIVASGSLKVIRSADPSVFHLYHPKNCTGIPGLSFAACVRSKGSNEGSKLQLGVYLAKLTEGIDIEGILSKRFYYYYWVPILIGSLIVCVVLIMCLSLSLYLLLKERVSRATKL